VVLREILRGMSHENVEIARLSMEARARGDAEAAMNLWENIEIRADEYLDTGGDEVVVLVHEIAKGRSSGIEVETDVTAILKIRGGKIVRVRPFMDRSKALEVAGLSE
jgi:ketosteroid isomerase-like protein